jgi:hypothetical protein
MRIKRIMEEDPKRAEFNKIKLGHDFRVQKKAKSSKSVKESVSFI